MIGKNDFGIRVVYLSGDVFHIRQISLDEGISDLKSRTGSRAECLWRKSLRAVGKAVIRGYKIQLRQVGIGYDKIPERTVREGYSAGLDGKINLAKCAVVSHAVYSYPERADVVGNRERNCRSSPDLLRYVAFHKNDLVQNAFFPVGKEYVRAQAYRFS